MKLLLTLIAACSLETARADIFTVINTSATGLGSFSQAISDADAHPNDPGVLDRIEFNIPTSDPNRNPATGVFTITPQGFALAVITDAVVIDAYTQGGGTTTTSDDAKPNSLALGNNAILLIEVSGASASGSSGIDFRAGSDGSTVRGLIINGFTAGVSINVSNVQVLGNFIGTNSAGAAAIANGSGINSSGDGGNQIGSPAAADRNVISGNGNGITLTNRGSAGNIVQNNYIGLNKAGTAALPNSNIGIVLTGVFAAPSGGTQIGASFFSLGQDGGNVIAGNGGSGILFNVGSGEFMGTVIIEGNIIGLGANGVTALGNGGSGIEEMTDPTATNGGASITGNLISSNALDGITYASSGTSVQGNVIGSDISTKLDRGNAGLGIQVVGDHRDANDPAATSITIGGVSSDARNLISGNDLGGISLRNANGVIEGNFIGTQGDGVSSLGNGADGIRVFNVLASPLLAIRVGGLADGAGNVIAHNAADGVHVEASTVAILRNSIFSNGPSDPTGVAVLGINLGSGPGVTPNDAGDADTGPNNLQNFPTLTSAKLANGNVEIIGSLSSRPSTEYLLEFFGNDGTDPSNFGEGKTFLGSKVVTTNGSGAASFDVSFPALEGALRVTSTATDPLGNTSEFSSSIGQLLNISTRLRVQASDKVLIGGFIVTGADPKRVLLRGIGPSLNGMGVTDALANPTLELHGSDGKIIRSNDNWKSDQKAEIEATGIPPDNDLESAIIATLPADGAGYTAILRGKNGATGIGLVETYDLDTAANSKLANISTRGFVETGNDVMIGGFILGGGTADVLVRALGPSLTGPGVAEALQDPVLELHDGEGTLVDSNDNWKSDQKAAIAATGIPPTKDKESAILATLLPGPYTAIVLGKNDTTGVALVEIYELN